MVGIGPRLSENQYRVYQVTAGIKGGLGAGWRYDGYLQVGRNNDENTQNNNVLRSKFFELAYAPDGGVALCGGYDPFGLTPITPECAAYVSVDGHNRSDVAQDIVELTANGPVFNLPAGSVQVAVGAMYKHDEYTYRSDPLSKVFLDDGISDVQGFNPALDTVGNDHNTDVYVEASLPLLRGLPGARSLDAVVGYRVSNYASAGSVDAYKAELLYQPIEPVRVRGSFQHAVRAPSVFELYLPQLGPSVGLPDDGDPCVAGSPARSGDHGSQVTSLCAAQGIPSALLPTYTYDDDFVDGVAGGNPDLKPESADTLTAGVVLHPSFSNRWLQQLQFSVDWYRIEVDDAIKTPFVATAVERCYDATFNPDFSVDNVYCSFFRRDPGTGNIVDAKEIYRNIGLLSTSGVDVQLDWKVDLGPGTLAANWLVSYVDSFRISDGPGIKADEARGTIGFQVGAALPEWKWNLRVDYAWSGIDLGMQWQYVDSMLDADPTTGFEVPSRSYYDAFIGYGFDRGPLSGLSVHAGVENLTDEQPPIFPSWVQANTDASQYDTLGRRYYLRMTYRF
jgi:outer membrane receptor protein involved in Fe transport